MQDLRVIGAENGALLVTSDDDTHYRIPIDDVLHSTLRQSAPEPASERKLAPREIQAHIRSGMSAQDVSAVTGVALEYIQKFEGPVLAEREYVISAALAVPVHTAIETDPLGEGSSFGSVIRERLHDLGATGQRWASWKEQGGGWVVKLSFAAEQIDHDARWQFDPKKSALAPLNSEAITLSQQGEMAGGLIPRLRAVGTEERQPDSSRFDSGAFHEDDLSSQDTAPYVDPLPFERPGTTAASTAAINRAQEPTESETGHTADLLDALRRRRGEREAAAFDDRDDVRTDHPATGTIRIVDVPLDAFTKPEATHDEPSGGSDGFAPSTPRPIAIRTGNTSTDVTTVTKAGVTSSVVPHPGPARLSTTKSTATGTKSAKKTRASLPSWDDIVFGAKSDDDL